MEEILAPETLPARIQSELAQVGSPSLEQLLTGVESGGVRDAVDHLVFFARPRVFRRYVEFLEKAVGDRLAVADATIQLQYLRFLVELSIGLRSFVPAWNLTDRNRHGRDALSEEEVKAAARDVQMLLARVARTHRDAAGVLCDRLRTETEGRLRAEGVQDADDAERRASEIAASVVSYVESIEAEISRSRLRTVCEMRLRCETVTEIGNDYAAFLPYAVWIGASFVTTNPVLIDRAWMEDPDYWGVRVDKIIADHPGAAIEDLTKSVTTEVVLGNMRILRPIFLLTEGRMGYVSLQVDPNRHGDAATMVHDARSIYGMLTDSCGGGVPNVVFKLPATRAGLDACTALTGMGIGVTVTVNFGMFQEMPFAGSISRGRASVSYLVEMNGRIAFPVRDELLARADSLAAEGIRRDELLWAAAWSGVAIHKRLFTALGESGHDTSRAKPLVASLRVYADEAYRDLPSTVPDFTEVLGTGVITVFPNVRRSLDEAVCPPLEPNSIRLPVPPRAMHILRNSEIFKQGYWLPGDGETYRPARPLVLEDQEAVAGWPPVLNTLTEFQRSYRSLKDRIARQRDAREVGTR